MNKRPTYAGLLSKIAVLEKAVSAKDATIARKEERIAYLERLLFGSKSDRIAAKAAMANQPGLFDGLFNGACDERAAQIRQTAEEIRTEAEKRRRTAKAATKRPSKYRYYGLEERRREVNPEGLVAADYDKIGEDVTRILHREPAKVWVEVIVRPIYRLKADKNNPSPKIMQAPAPTAVIGGNHVWADLPAQLVTDKHFCHLPKCRQVRQYADMGLKMPASTVNDRIHAVAAKPYPPYESPGGQIRARHYLQIDEVPWRIADNPGKCRKRIRLAVLRCHPRFTRPLLLLSQRLTGGGHTAGATQGLSRSNPD